MTAVTVTLFKKTVHRSLFLV